MLNATPQIAELGQVLNNSNSIYVDSFPRLELVDSTAMWDVVEAQLEAYLSVLLPRTDVVVGTQMLAKGHDLPSVTLVGVILADRG